MGQVTSLQASATAPGHYFSEVIKVCNGLTCFCKETTITYMILLRNLWRRMDRSKTSMKVQYKGALFFRESYNIFNDKDS